MHQLKWEHANHIEKSSYDIQLKIIGKHARIDTSSITSRPCTHTYKLLTINDATRESQEVKHKHIYLQLERKMYSGLNY